MQGSLLLSGSAVRAHREQLKFSQVDLADKAGINRSHVSRLEAGNRRVSERVYAKLKAALQATGDDLLMPEGSPVREDDGVRAGALVAGAVMLLRRAHDLAPALVDLDLIHELEQVVDWTSLNPD